MNKTKKQTGKVVLNRDKHREVEQVMHKQCADDKSTHNLNIIPFKKIDKLLQFKQSRRLCITPFFDEWAAMAPQQIPMIFIFFMIPSEGNDE